VLLITGTGLSRQPSRDATFFAAEQARAHNAKVVLDLDFRPELWPDVRAYGVALRSIMHLVDVVIGTIDEVKPAVLLDWVDQAGGDAQTSATDVDSNLINGIGAVLASGPQALVMKRGAASTLIYLPGGEILEAATFPVDVLNVLGAGDAFASGFLYGYLKGWDWQRAARMGNACGAIVVTRHGCANFMPYEHEALTFIEERGGF
jgi:5-dehydro-2-deoxygluconokinase